MSSTRNKNSPGDYKLEQNAYIDRHSNIMDIHKQTANQKALAGNGLLQGKVASRDLANNYTDIESTLFGIGSTNLVKPLPTIIPDIYSYSCLNIINKIPVIVPNPITIDQNQRANYLS
jgi:hypothetical protein